MRRLTLILSDLYLPEEATNGGGAEACALPGLEWLMRFARHVERIGDWRSWLAAELGAAHLAGVPVAQCCAEGLLSSADARDSWLATPVRLEARLDHVRLADRGLLRLDAVERRTCCEEFASVLGPAYSLHDAGERTFLLSGAGSARVASVDPARLLGGDIGHALPSVPAGRELRRLGIEIEMWLHGAALNTARERAGRPRISALWLWGSGAIEIGKSLEVDRTSLGAIRLYGGDVFLAALASRSAQSIGTAPAPPMPAPDSFAALDHGVTRSVVELTPMSGPSESLASLETHWFAPARSALSAGRLDCVDVIANDRWFCTAARPGWRIWRRPVPWLAALGRGAKA
jgi:hypothetical protein